MRPDDLAELGTTGPTANVRQDTGRQGMSQGLPQPARNRRKRKVSMYPNGGRVENGMRSYLQEGTQLPRIGIQNERPNARNPRMQLGRCLESARQ